MSRRPFFAFGDTALIELASHNALHFHQLLGPYSRFGWNHPGPLYFYILAPFSLLVDSPLYVYIGALAINWVSLISVVALVRREAGLRSRNVACVAAGVCLLLYALGISFVRDPWNPAVVICPLLLAVTAAACRPSLTAALALVLSGSFVAQSHVSTVPLVGLLVSIVILRRLIALGLPSARWLIGDDNTVHTMPRFRSVAAAGTALAICWLPTIVQQVTTSPGNLGRVILFFRQGHRQHTFSHSFNALTAGAWLPLTPLRSDFPRPLIPGSIAVGAAVVVAVACVVFGWRRHQRLTVGFGTFAALGFSTGVVSISHIQGHIDSYLFWWAAVIAISLVIAVVLTAFGDGGLIALPFAPVAVVFAVLATVMITSTVHDHSLSTFSRPDTKTAWALIEPRLPTKGATVLLDIGDNEVSPQAAGIAVELERHGWKWDVPTGWRTVYGRSKTEPAVYPALTISFMRQYSGNDLADPRYGLVIPVPGGPNAVVRFGSTPDE